MTWLFVTFLVIFSLFKILVTCLPSGVVEWLTGKFQVHVKLEEANVKVTFGGEHLEGSDKSQFIQNFNEAVFMERYYIYPGDEPLYVNPKNAGTPFVIETKRGKNAVKLLVYRYDDHIDVVKQYKKKTAVYCLRSDSLQTCGGLKTADLI
ncbi:YfmQ family protein [Bacillus licheniformis]|nr:YfmQ family protein [Bacillus licheniformis]WIY57118.1 YfmQ family protein [Bacillus licheniformis]